MPIGVAELDGDLHAGATAALEIDRHVMGAQPVARQDHLVERADLEGEMVQLGAA